MIMDVLYLRAENMVSANELAEGWVNSAARGKAWWMLASLFLPCPLLSGLTPAGASMLPQCWVFPRQLAKKKRPYRDAHR